MDDLDNDWSIPLKFDFRVGDTWGYYDQSLENVVYIKRWQAAMRRDMRMLFAKEVEENLYEVDQFFWENVFDRGEQHRPNDDYSFTMVERILGECNCSPDAMPLLTRLVLYWSETRYEVEHHVRKLWDENLTETQRQQAYLGWYAAKNIPGPHYNHGAIQDDWFVYHFEANSFEKKKAVFECRDSFENAAQQQSADIRCAHTTVRLMLIWLASDEGQAFTQACERNIAIKEERAKALRMPQYSIDSPVQKWLAQRP